MTKTPQEMYQEREEARLLKQAMSALGKKSAASLTPEQRKERASKAAQARWNSSETQENAL